MYATLNTGTVNRSLTTADLTVPDSNMTGACGLHAVTIPVPAAEVSPTSLALKSPDRDAFFALATNSTAANAFAPTALFQTLALDAVFANATRDSGAMLAQAKLGALNATLVFAAASSSGTDEDSLADTLAFPDACQVRSGGEAMSASGPAFDRPDAHFDFIPTNGALMTES
jgi:hypothetical protein